MLGKGRGWFIYLCGLVMEVDVCGGGGPVVAGGMWLCQRE